MCPSGKELSRVIKMFYVLIWMLVIWVDTFDKTPAAAHLKPVHFTDFGIWGNGNITKVKIKQLSAIP